MARKGKKSKKLLRIGDTATFRLLPGMARVEQIVDRLNREENISEFVRQLVIDQIEREEGREILPLLNPDVLGSLVATALRELVASKGAGVLQTILREVAREAACQEESPPAQTGASALSRGRSQLRRLLDDD